MDFLKEDEAFILNTYRRINLEIDKIRGNYIYTADGRRYLDFFSGIAVNNLGYDEDVIRAITEKLQRYTHISNYFADDDRTRLAKMLVESSIDGKVFFTNSGCESAEAALKLVKKWGIKNNKSKILTAENSFHGRTTGALALTGQKKYQKDFLPLMENIEHFKFNDAENLVSAVNEDTAAVFLEAVQGESGVIPLKDEFVSELVGLKNKYGFILVMDEIQTGLRRCGTMFAYENYDLMPDIILLAKALGGGLPLGAMVVSKPLENVLTAGDHGSTFGGNPVACAAGAAVLKKLADSSFAEEIKINSAYLYGGLKQLQRQFPSVVGEIRGISMMLGLDAGTYALEIRERAMEEGVLINITNTQVVRVIPPLTVTKEQIDLFIRAMEKSISAIR